MELTTAKGKTYEFTYVGRSGLDGGLYFAVKSDSIADVSVVFSDKDETTKLSFLIDDMTDPKVYEGYTKLTSLVKSAVEDTVTIGLAKGAE